MSNFAERRALFAYDTAASFDVVEASTETRAGVIIKDISFVGVPGGSRVNAYLVAPEGEGTFAGVLWAHWLGDVNSNRNQFLEEAAAMASKGVVSLLVDAMWSAGENWYGTRGIEKDYENSIQQTIELQRAMDFLLSQPNVDKNRIAFVGHDYGAMYGILAEGALPRAKAYVIIAAAPSLYEWAFFAEQPASKIDYIRQMAVFELTDYLAQIQNAAFFFQFSQNDPYISRTDGLVLYSAAAEPKSIKAYAAEHSMNLPEIRADRQTWLAEQLGLA